ncbi:gamma subclass chorismate mutase AroQ [Undibacterium sp. TJN25]|uniref:gamma subclass chorismate mutase AroQ n=1 Tax=Undibacterium sp. TJN25 TaxID=3413056 RepID=UPI003BF2DFA9
MLSSRQPLATALFALSIALLLQLGACTCTSASTLPGADAEEAAIRHLALLMDERLAVAPLVAKSKWNSGAAIDDPQREKQILNDIGLRARQEGLDPSLAGDFFQSQFDAGKIVQNRLHAQWRSQQREPFVNPPNLVRDVRPVLDRLTPELILALKDVQPHLCDAGVQDFLAHRAEALFSKDWDQDTVTRALSPLRCRR